MTIQTRNFREVVLENAIENPIFRAELLHEALEQLACGEVQVGLSLLEEYINATIGFLKEAESHGGVDFNAVLLYDHINAAVGYDKAGQFETGELWQNMVCDVPERAGRSALTMV